MKRQMGVSTYVGYVKDNEIRVQSSSGGIFYLLSKYIILSMHGVVFGARFDEKWNVEHGYCEKIEDVNNFMGSKYVQSDLKNVYIQTKDFLDQGRWVLFSGTPCQIYGLKAFLKDEYKTLLTMDFICHGVASPLTWEKYLREISKEKEISSVNFRDKTNGWRNYSLKINFSDGSSYKQDLNHDYYMRGYLANIFLRPSCYCCIFKAIERKADITLGDFWGIDNMPEVYNKEGVSVIFVHSELGQNVLQMIKGEVELWETNFWTAIDENSAFMQSAEKPAKREDFFRSIRENFSLVKSIGHCTSESLSTVVKKFLSKVIISIKILLRK